MNLTLLFHRQFRWLNLPGALLFALLQRTPAVQVAATAAEFVAASPVGNVLRSAALAAASLGAMHSMAGATQFVASRNPVTGTVGAAITPATFSVTGAQTTSQSYRIVSGSLPPGLILTGLDTTTNIVNTTIGIITGTPTAAGSFSILLRAYEFTNAQGDSWPATAGVTLSFTISGAAASAPAFTTQPVSQTANVGANVTFTATATGSPTPAFQWTRNNIAITGATSATLSLPNVQTTDAGSYSVTATNSAGAALSNAATLTVNAPVSRPTFTTQPVAQTMALGSTVVFSAVANDAATFQWRLNGTAIAGANKATLVVSNPAAAQAGAYTCVATNSSGSTTSNPATLTLVAGSDPGRLSNLSVLTDITAGSSFTVGTVVGGAGTNGTKALVVRAVGPSLGALGVPGTIADPQLTLFNSSSVSIAANDNWGSNTAAVSSLTNAMASVGAFAFTGATSKDAAVYQPSLLPGNYSVQVSGVGGATGTAIAEIYDATPAGTFTPASPRLVNVSVLKPIAAGGLLTLGFTIDGATARTVLIRVVGPGLAAVGVTTGTLGDPQLTLFNSASSAIAANDDWGADPQLISAGAQVNAFAIGSNPSKDAMLLVTLPKGGYTAQAKGNGGTSGLAIVEVYEVP